MRADLALAFTAGALAAFNPCGFALLPAYLAMFLGDRSSRGSALARALSVGALLTLGFVATFGVVGMAVIAVSLRFGTWLSVITIALGVTLLAFGVLIAVGREPVIRLPRASLRVDSSPVGMVSYGVVYATVSLSCTLPIFLAAVGTSFGVGASAGGLFEGSLSLLAYSAGMGAVMTILATAFALLGAAVPSAMQRIKPYVGRVSAVFLILAGAYIVWYGWVEYQSFQGSIITTGPTAWVAQWSAQASRWVLQIPTGVLIALAGALVAITIAIGRRTRSAGSATAHRVPEPEGDPR